MTPLQSIDAQLATVAAEWGRAVRDENRAAEAVRLAKLNRLLDLRLATLRRPAPTTPSHL